MTLASATSPRLVGCVGLDPALQSVAPGPEVVRVWVPVLVDTDGRVLSVGSVTRAFGGRTYVAEALSIAPTCVYEPAYDNGEAVSRWHEQVFVMRR